MGKLRLRHQKNNSKGEICMSIMAQLNLNYNSKVKINFEGGDLSADGGMHAISEFIHTLSFDKLLENEFFLPDDIKKRIHTFPQLCLQLILQTIAGYHHQDHANDLRADPLFPILLDKKTIASQPTLSRFITSLTSENTKQLEGIHEELLERLYELSPPEHFLIDLDSSHFSTYGKQYGAAYNAHYQKEGFHPNFAFDGLTGALLKAELRSGNVYTSRQVVRFIGPLLKKYKKEYPGVLRTIRADSGFALPELFELCEELETLFCIRLKSNKSLQKKGHELAAPIFKEEFIQEECTLYKEFSYQANSWKKARRVVVKVVKPKGEMVPTLSFFVTNMTLSPKMIFKFYANRGTMENFIKEIKNGFRMDLASHSDFITNVNKMQIIGLAYNIVNGFKRIVLPEKIQKIQIETIRKKILKVPTKKVKHAGKTLFKFYSAYPYKELFAEIIINIQSLKPLRL